MTAAAAAPLPWISADIFDERVDGTSDAATRR
jgi:hypothetical protein